MNDSKPESQHVPAVITAEAVISWARGNDPRQFIWQQHDGNGLVVTYLREMFGVQKAWMGCSLGVTITPFHTSFRVDAPLERALRAWSQAHLGDKREGSPLGTLLSLLEAAIAQTQRNEDTLDS